MDSFYCKEGWERGLFPTIKKFRTLRYIYLEEGVEEIGNNAFKSGLVEELYIPKSLKKLDPTAFNDTMDEEKNLITTQIYTASEEQSKAFRGKKLEPVLLEEPDWEKGRQEIRDKLEKEEKEKQEVKEEEKKEDPKEKEEEKKEDPKEKKEDKKENPEKKEEKKEEGQSSGENNRRFTRRSFGSGNSGREATQQGGKAGQVLGEQRYRSFSTKDNHSWQKKGEFWYFIPQGEEALKDDWAKIDGRWYHFPKPERWKEDGF